MWLSVWFLFSLSILSNSAGGATELVVVLLAAISALGLVIWQLHRSSLAAPTCDGVASTAAADGNGNLDGGGVGPLVAKSW